MFDYFLPVVMATQVAEPVRKETAEENKPADSSADTAEQPVKPAIHPLQNTWTLWFFKQDSAKEWSDCFQEIMSFNSIEGFWSCFRLINYSGS